ncbi:MAG TPA: ATP-binding protein [Pyrinomonadaceae bacterium]|nr:ATP-binding protein [Pyrinomonadaceae bacterium]
MTAPIETFKMETNFDGLIQLLAKHLYSEPDVFVRELIQNAHDAIQRRCIEESDLAGRIDIEYDVDKKTITFCDNGIGMDKKDIKQFLSVIGSGGTIAAIRALQEKGHEAAYKLIGQFGIGFLSAFVVADNVVVQTRKLGTSESYAWHNAGSLDCELYPGNLDHVGTEITIHLNYKHLRLLEEKKLISVIRKYCDFVPFPISLNGRGPVNAADEVPFYRTLWASKEEKEISYKLFVERRYPDIPLDVIPIEINEPYVTKGVLYISDRAVPDIDTSGRVDIVVRRMFIRADDATVLPPWAKFVSGVIDGVDLNPTAARDNIDRAAPSFKFLHQRLGEIIVDRLSYLATNEPIKFRKINHWHHYHLKGMACHYDDFFERVSDLLLFDTNKGQMSLEEYLTKNSPRIELGNKTPIYYFAFQGSSTQFYRLAEARGWVVINAGSVFDEEFLRKYVQKHDRTIKLVSLDTTDDPELFQQLSTSELDKYRQLETDMEGHLHRIGLTEVVVRMRRFAPAEVPAVIIIAKITESQARLRDWATQAWLLSAAEDIVEEALKQEKNRPLYLDLNADNPLIQKLSSIDRQNEMVKEIMTGIYNCAVLHSHNLLTQHNTEVMHNQFVRLFERLIGSQDEMQRVQQSIEQERVQLRELLKKQADAVATRPEHVLLFMITPFAEEYERLEDAVRNVFERAPYFFEVRLARDYVHKDGLLENVLEHLRRAHGFIAEISDLNPNVMFELGAAMLAADGRPIFSLRSRGAVKDVPADIKEKLRVDYGSLSDPLDRIACDIAVAFERDGRIIHEGIRALLAERKKRFLSRTLLESSQVRLQPRQIELLMNNYVTVEDFLKANVADVVSLTNLSRLIVQAIQAELAEG